MPVSASPNAAAEHRSPRPSRVNHNGEAARVVRDREPGVSPVTALHRHFRAGLDRYEPVTGLNDHPGVVAFHRLVFTTPSLAGRLTQYMLEDEEALAGASARELRHGCGRPRYSRSSGCSPGPTGRKSPTGEPLATSTPRLWPTPTTHSLNCGNARAV